jgi:hypothetical protein
MRERAMPADAVAGHHAPPRRNWGDSAGLDYVVGNLHLARRRLRLARVPECAPVECCVVSYGLRINSG